MTLRPTVKVGSANVVGRAHSNPMPSSHDTSMTIVPGDELGQVVVGEEHQRVVGVLQHAVDDDVVLAEELRERHPALGGDGVAHPAGGVVGVEVQDPGGVDRRGHGGDLPVGQDVDVTDAEGGQRRDGPAGGGAEADDDGAAAGGRSCRSCRPGSGRAAPRRSRPARCSCGTRAGRTTRPRFQWFIASKAMRVSRRSTASWVSSSSCTQCGQPHSTWPVAQLGHVARAAAWAAG